MAIVVLLLRLRGSGFQWDLLFSTLGSVDPWWLSASIAFIACSYVGRALRWRVMIRGVCPHPSLWGLLKATVVGFTAVVFFGRPGEFARPYLIARREHVPFSSQMAAWVVERIYDLLIVLLLFGFALTRLEGRHGLGPNLELLLRTGGYLAGLVGAACVAVLFISAAYSHVARTWAQWFSRFLPLRFRAPMLTTFDAFMSGMAHAGSPTVVVELILFSLVEWAVIVGSIACLFLAFPATAHLKLVDDLVFTGFVAFGAAVQVPGIGGGLQVAAVVVLTELFGLPLESATAMAMFLWATSWLIVVPFGVLFAFWEGLQWSSLRHVDQEMLTAEKIVK